MARSTKTLTTSWQLLSSTRAVFTVRNTKAFPIYFNETNSDTNMLIFTPKQGDQFNQSEVKDTYARVGSENAGAKIVVVEEG